MKKENLWDELLKRAMKDPEYGAYCKNAEEREKDYLEVCKILSPEQIMVIEDYIAACESQGDYLTALAYDMGKYRG